MITFSNHHEAYSAYRSTEAVLNNRFIKVFWHDADGNKQENVPPVQQSAVKDRLGAPSGNKVCLCFFNGLETFSYLSIHVLTGVESVTTKSGRIRH